MEERLSEDDTRHLIERYSKLVDDYSKGQLDRDLINDIKLRNDVSSKVGIIRNSLRKQSR